MLKLLMLVKRLSNVCSSQLFSCGQFDGKSCLTKMHAPKVNCVYEFSQRMHSSGFWIRARILALISSRNSDVSYYCWFIAWGRPCKLYRVVDKVPLACVLEVRMYRFKLRCIWSSFVSEFFMKRMA